MANHASAEKRNRQREKRTDRNRNVTSAVRTAVKKARQAIADGDKDAATLASQAKQKLARAASKGIVHPRAASRTTARIARALSSKQA